MPFSIVRDEIARQSADVVIVPANTSLAIDGGAGLAVGHVAGISKLQAACNIIGYCDVGCAVATHAFDFPAKRIVHAVGPEWDGTDEARALLAKTYSSALAVAIETGARNIVLPLLASGARNCPSELSLHLALESVKALLAEDPDVDVKIVVFDEPATKAAGELFPALEQFIDNAYATSHENRYGWAQATVYGSPYEVPKPSEPQHCPREVAAPPSAQQRYPRVAASQAPAKQRHQRVAAGPSATEASRGRKSKGKKRDGALKRLLSNVGQKGEPKAKKASSKAATATESGSRVLEAESNLSPTASGYGSQATESASCAPVSAPWEPIDKGALSDLSEASAAPEQYSYQTSKPYEPDAYQAADEASGSRLASAADEASGSWSAPAADEAFAQKNLEDLLDSLDEPFSTTLLSIIDSRGLDDAEVYKRANLSRQHFSKIRSNTDYRPTKRTVLALAIALELTLGETEDLLRRAGLAFSPASKADLIVEWFIIRGDYDIFSINEALYAYDQPLLG